MNTAAQLPALLTPTEVCRALRISRSTLGRMVDRGDLAAIRLGRVGSALRIPASELERLTSVSAPSAGRSVLLGGSAPTLAPTPPKENTE